MQKEKFHTHLAVLYLERVLSLLSQSPTDEEQLTRARERLQALLRESNLYRAQFLLGETCLTMTMLEYFRLELLSFVYGYRNAILEFNQHLSVCARKTNRL